MNRRAPRDPFGAIHALSLAATRERLGGKSTAHRLLKGIPNTWPDSPPVPSSASARLTAATEVAADRLAAAGRRKNMKGTR